MSTATATCPRRLWIPAKAIDAYKRHIAAADAKDKKLADDLADVERRIREHEYGRLLAERDKLLRNRREASYANYGQATKQALMDAVIAAQPVALSRARDVLAREVRAAQQAINDACARGVAATISDVDLSARLMRLQSALREVSGLALELNYAEALDRAMKVAFDLTRNQE